MGKADEKGNKQHKKSKGEITRRIIATILVILMILSVCATGIYYLYSMLTS